MSLTYMAADQTRENKGVPCTSGVTRLGDAVRRAVGLARYRRIGMAIAAIAEAAGA